MPIVTEDYKAGGVNAHALCYPSNSLSQPPSWIAQPRDPKDEVGQTPSWRSAEQGGRELV